MPMTFQQALEISGDTKKTVLLGNGFSIAGDPVFDYRLLIERARLNESLLHIFRGLDTADFEIVIEHLNIAASIIEQFDNNHIKLARDMRLASDQLRNEFAACIARVHAPFSEVFRNVGRGLNIRPRNCWEFLKYYSNIFTTNYDLLLYWQINTRSNTGQFDDGFRRGGNREPLVYQPGDDQNVFYIHGNLFIQELGVNTFKLRKGDVSLLDIVRDNILNFALPLIVFEGNSRLKKLRIDNSVYLESCLTALCNLSGDLFIHGHSLSEKDQHIFNAINQSDKVANIFISAVNKSDDGAPLQDSRAEAMLRLARRRLGERENRNIYVYDGRSVNVWE